jgi:hypothetical protein
VTRLQQARSRQWIVVLFLLAGACSGRACSGCSACQRAETCEECVKRCVDTQGVSPDVCRGAACSNLCEAERKK